MHSHDKCVCVYQNTIIPLGIIGLMEEMRITDVCVILMPLILTPHECRNTLMMVGSRVDPGGHPLTCTQVLGERCVPSLEAAGCTSHHLDRGWLVFTGGHKKPVKTE